MKLKDLAIATIAAACIATFLFIVTNANKRAEQELIQPELCQVGHANPDGSITLTEDTAGIYQYHVLVTATGVIVLAPCK